MRHHHHHDHEEGHGGRRHRAFGPGPYGPGPGGPFGPGGPRRGGRGGRARRGDVRAAILALLGEQPMHGYQIIQELESRSNGLWRPSPGSIYPTLQLFEDEGLVTASEVEGRRVFGLTEAGTARLAEAPPGAATPWEAVANETPTDIASLRDGIRALMAATHQVAHAGSRGQSERALEVLADARRKIYAILAEDDTAPAPEA
ncbi:MAG TPA: PadR family transcriptional regulator [Gaiellales bacterium]|jgi:DNA-binding PadR family transcriptional regulator